MILRPLRLVPGSDLRRALDEYLKVSELHSAFVVSGIGSLVRAKLRFADNAGESPVSGPLELLSLAGLENWRLAREHDEATGWKELVIRPLK